MTCVGSQRHKGKERLGRCAQWLETKSVSTTSRVKRRGQSKYSSYFSSPRTKNSTSRNLREKVMLMLLLDQNWQHTGHHKSRAITVDIASYCDLLGNRRRLAIVVYHVIVNGLDSVSCCSTHNARSHSAHVTADRIKCIHSEYLPHPVCSLKLAAWKAKVMFTLQSAMKAQRGNRSIALPCTAGGVDG